MQKRSRNPQQQSMFSGLEEMLNPKDPLYQLARKIPWEELQRGFSKYYVEFGRPAKETRLMISLLILKQIYDLGDEDLVKQWTQNPYWQYLGGQEQFQWKLPCDPSEMSHFRKRIGEEGVQRIFKLSVDLHGNKDVAEAEVVVDTTVQEKNITFPTDTKLYRKVAAKCIEIARDENIELRRSYRRTIPKLIFAQRGRNRPRGYKKAIKAQRKLKTIAGRLVREIERKLPVQQQERYAEQLNLFKRVLEQQRSDKNKIYSLHEPHVYCISKGKEHKKYEYGSKVSIAMTKKSAIIVSAMNLEKNVYDGKTLPAVLQDIERHTGKRPEVVIVDQGYRGKQQIEETRIISAKELRKKLSKYEKQKTRKRLRRRAAIEPVISHLKSEFRLARNYLKGVVGDHLNVLMAAAAFNIKKWLNKVASLIFLFFSSRENRLFLAHHC